MMLPAFHMQTYGCQMNASDSEWLSRALISRGFSSASFEEASIYILNTCSVREKPEKKVYSELGRIARYSKVHKKEDVIVCVGGCVAQQVGEALVKRFPQVRLLFGTDGISHAPKSIEQLVENKNLRINLLDFATNYEEREDPWITPLHTDKSEQIGNLTANHSIPPSVFVNIMQGCNNFCTYCIVPYVRGRQKSREAASILHECQQLVSQGAREITLLGQNVNSFGLDDGRTLAEDEAPPFAELLHKISQCTGLERLRFVTPHPKDISPRVIEAFGESKVLCPRLHLPLQSGSDTILKKMGRKYTVEKFLSTVNKLKEVRPDIVFSTDIIVGFPGETEENFCQTLEIMKEVGFAASYSFVYSDRPNAKAVLFKDKVDRSVALERLSRLQAWQNEHTERLLKEQIGLVKHILIESKSQKEASAMQGGDEVPPCGIEGITWQGRTDQGFIVHISLPSSSNAQWIGKILPVTITDAGRHSLKAKQAGEPC